MSLCLYESGAIRIVVKYVQERNGRYYFRRRVPEDARSLYPDRRAVEFFSLKTRSLFDATKRADQEARKQDALWQAHREGQVSQGPEVEDAAVAILDSFGLRPGYHQRYEAEGLEPDEFYSYLTSMGNFVRSAEDQYDQEKARNIDDPRSSLGEKDKLAWRMFAGEASPSFRFSDAVRLHQAEIGENEGHRNFASRRKASERFMSLCGDLKLSDYTRSHARAFRDSLREDGLKSASIRRNINYVSPVFNTAIRENDLKSRNPFESIRIQNLGSDARVREPFTPSEILKLQKEAVLLDDDIRHLVALLSDTGFRIAEAAGACVEDVHINTNTPWIEIRKNGYRTAKTDLSYRKVPLVGYSLWAIQKRLERVKSGPLFTRYIAADPSKQTAKFTHASNTLNKWIRSQGINKTCHSFRHAVRDRLREIGAPEEVQDSIGGWKSRSIGRSYGQGYTIETLGEWMQRIVISDR